MTQPAMSTARMPSWSTLVGHQSTANWFRNAIHRRRLGGSFLLVGSPGIGKRTVARLLARTLLCQSADPREMTPCGRCESCIQVEAGTHPDVVRLSKPADKSLIPLELLIGPKEARMREGFCRDLHLKPMTGDRKVAILEDADFLSEEGANCLLKTLEEPPSGTVVLLVGTSEQKQLPTIRSRCRILQLGPLRLEDAMKLLRDVHQIEATDDQIREAIEISAGDMHSAARLLAQGADQLREALTKQFRSRHPDPLALCRILTSYVEDAGKDVNKRRGAMRDAFSISVQYFRRQLRQDALNSRSDLHTISRLDRSIRAIREVDRSANQATLIECFAADIAFGTTGDRGQIG